MADVLENPLYRVDVNRGSHIRFTTGGVAVYMHVDEPGVFYNEQNKPASDELAQQAGFDVEKLVKMRRRNEAIRKAVSAIDHEFEFNSSRDVVEERGEYRLVKLSDDRYNVEFDDGTVMNPRGPLPYSVALQTFDLVAGPKPEETAVEGEVSQPAEPSAPAPKGKK